MYLAPFMGFGGKKRRMRNLLKDDQRGVKRFLIREKSGHTLFAI
jgi:hypothetical protein